MTPRVHAATAASSTPSVPALPPASERRNGLIAEIMRAKKAKAPIEAAGKALGYAPGRPLAEYADAELDALLEKAKALDIATAQDERAVEPQDEPGSPADRAKGWSGVDIKPKPAEKVVPGKATQAEMVVYLNMPVNIKVRDEVMIDLRIEPMPMSRLGVALLRELYDEVRKRKEAEFDGSIPF